MSTLWVDRLRENVCFVSLPVRHPGRERVLVYCPGLARCLNWRFRAEWEVRMLNSGEGNQGRVAGKHPHGHVDVDLRGCLFVICLQRRQLRIARANGEVAEHGEDAIARIGDSKMAGSMELVHEAEAIGVAAGHRRLDEALEDILDQVGLDMEALA